MKKMHYNKQCDKLIYNGINSHNSENCVSTTDSERDTKRSEANTTLTFEVNTKNRNAIKHHHNNHHHDNEEESDIEKYNKKGTTTSCTSSTDSGVNISDNDEIPPSPTSSHLHSFPSTNSSSSETTTTPNLLNKQFHKNYKNTNRDNSYKNNNSNNNNNVNQYNNHVFNDNDDDDDKISSDIDNKLKIEQYRNQPQQQQQKQKQFLNVENSSNGANNIRYNQRNRNNIESENEININHQQHFTTATPTITVTTNTNDTPSLLQQNEFINRPQRSASSSSSLSMASSHTNNYEKHNPPSNKHHCDGSPVVSIRSINSSTIITDSDTDSDLNEESENYVIKKLGTQVSYPPNHPSIPHINSGQTVLNQRILPNDDHVPLSPLATLAALGDNIGAAQALGPVPSLSAVPQRPQIGSIALSNSSDVTFGDKHFYEGPVTIQQFLIDSRDKWKETNEKDNPTFQNENGETLNKAKDINSALEPSGKRKKLIIAGVLSVMVLLIVAAVLGSKALSNSKNTNGNEANDDYECSGNGTLCYIDRDVWRAHPRKDGWNKQTLPLDSVIIAHTATEECHNVNVCAERVRIIQEFHMGSYGWSDIGYNFLISSDGKVYVGRGWNIEGAHTKGYNKGSVGIAFIGTFVKDRPSDEQLKACQALLEEGVHLKKLTPNYRLYGARQLSATESPGATLYNIIKKWPNWTVDVKKNT